MAPWPKTFLLDFIKLYKTLEALWLIKSKDYYNAAQRNSCYDILLKKVLTIEPTATRDTVTKRLYDLRRSFEEEHKKVQASLASATSAGDVYVPKLWCYADLLFLKDQEEPHQSTSAVSAESPSTEDSKDTSRNTRQPESSPSSKTPKRKHPHTQSISPKILRIIGHHLSSLRQDDEFDILGKQVALKFRSLCSEQRLIAEKIIKDTMFEAQLGNLSSASRLVIPSKLPQLPEKSDSPDQPTDKQRSRPTSSTASSSKPA